MALKGIKVLELAGLAPVPFCGMVLADFGASVVRIDKVPSSTMEIDVLGNGKRSIAVNLKSEKGVNIFKQLSDQSDVIIDSYRKGVMEKLKLGPQDLMKTNKRLIYARLTGFGQDGAYARMAGHDINYLALSGLLSLFGRANEKPTAPINFAADFAGGGLVCAFGILLALLERSKSGVGQIIDASMTEGAAYLGSWLFRSQELPFLWGNPRGKNVLDTGAHFYDVYETKDGSYMSVGALEPQFYEILLEKLGLSNEDVPHYTNFDENREKIASVFKKKTQQEWCDIFEGTDACVTPVLDIKDVMRNKHNSERKTFYTQKDRLFIPNPAPRLSMSPGRSTGSLPNPRPGENTIEILSEIKVDPKDIEGLISEGVVVQAKKPSKI